MLDYMLTLDEAILPNNHTNGQTDHYYAKKKEADLHRLQLHSNNFRNNAQSNSTFYRSSKDKS